MDGGPLRLCDAHTALPVRSMEEKKTTVQAAPPGRGNATADPEIIP